MGMAGSAAGGACHGGAGSVAKSWQRSSTVCSMHVRSFCCCAEAPQIAERDRPQLAATIETMSANLNPVEHAHILQCDSECTDEQSCKASLLCIHEPMGCVVAMWPIGPTLSNYNSK